MISFRNALCFRSSYFFEIIRGQIRRRCFVTAEFMLTRRRRVVIAEFMLNESLQQVEFSLRSDPS